MRHIKKNIFAILIFVFINTILIAQTNFYEPLKLDTVNWSYDDFGKMWTFDNVPVEMFEKKYGFKPTEEWLNDVQKSALQFGGGCSAAFVSADGLIMTNHHCGRGQLSTVQKEGENILKDGFYAESLNEERKIENLFVDQLILIEDVTEKIKSYMNNGETDDDKVNLRDEMKDSLVTQYSKKTGLKCRIVTLYHGSQYSLYGYKRYNDIRLVMAPDFQIAATGWDWDNFTYPRYELDFMFYRAYDEDGKPVKSNNHFTWSQKGAEENEPIFVVGRPGSTDRLVSYEQLEFFRDYTYPHSLIGFNSIYSAYFDLYMKYPESQKLLNRVMGWGNARKSYAGRLAGLNNKYLMKKKLEFQNDLISKVKDSKKLSEEYGKLWESINTVLNEMKPLMAKNRAVIYTKNVVAPNHIKIASELLNIAKSKEESKEKLTNEELEMKFGKYFEQEFGEELELNVLNAHNIFLTSLLGSSDKKIEQLYSDRSIKELMKSSELNNKNKVFNIAKLDPEAIYDYEDPFIKFVKIMDHEFSEFSPKLNELNNTLKVLNQSLGEVITKVYGNNIPPDATSTLRISDGTIKGYEYNGTIAPGKTTYYGLWDRYESFNKKTYPWGLHERWRKVPEELDLATDIGFASTNDIVGGNSGSSAININKEVVGLVHDGNIESLAGHTIFLEENNRTVATDSDGIIEALKYIYKADKLVEELLEGKLK